MSSAQVLVANALMAVGKLSILILFSINVHANNAMNPSFFKYDSGSFTNTVKVLTFGWFRTLDDNEKHAYYSAINHALFAADDGEHVRWNQGRAWGVAMPAVSWSTGGGYCRRLHIQATKYDVTKTMSRTACYQNGLNHWTWFSDK